MGSPLARRSLLRQGLLAAGALLVGCRDGLSMAEETRDRPVATPTRRAIEQVLIGAFDVGPGGCPQCLAPARRSAGLTWLSKLWAPLVTWDPSMTRLLPELAESWETNAGLDRRNVEPRVERIEEAYPFDDPFVLHILRQHGRDLVQTGAGPDLAVPDRKAMLHAAAQALHRHLGGDGEHLEHERQPTGFGLRRLRVDAIRKPLSNDAKELDQALDARARVVNRHQDWASSGRNRHEH